MKKSEKKESFFEEEKIKVIWNRLKCYFNYIKKDLEEIKKIRDGDLDAKDHQLTIDQVVKKIYEVM
jgi:hypothetical protein